METLKLDLSTLTPLPAETLPEETLPDESREDRKARLKKYLKELEA